MKKLIGIIILSIALSLSGCASSDSTDGGEILIGENPYIGFYQASQTSFDFSKIEIFDSSDDDIEGDENILFINKEGALIGTGYFLYTEGTGESIENPILISFDDMEFSAYFSEDKNEMFVALSEDLSDNKNNADITSFQKDRVILDDEKEIENHMDYLIDTLGDKISNKSVVETGQATINNLECKTFAIGVNTPEKFTAEEHYAISDKGDIFVLDVVNGGDWIKYTP